MTGGRYHPGREFLEDPMVQKAFQVFGAILLATKSKDMEADFMMGDGEHEHHFHIEISEVNNG